jgi:hypothetical protein
VLPNDRGSVFPDSFSAFADVIEYAMSPESGHGQSLHLPEMQSNTSPIQARDVHERNMSALAGRQRERHNELFDVFLRSLK